VESSSLQAKLKLIRSLPTISISRFGSYASLHFEALRIIVPELRDHVPESNDEDFVLRFPLDD
jgi:hypothetical protein